MWKPKKTDVMKRKAKAGKRLSLFCGFAAGSVAAGRRKIREAEKGFNWIVRSCYLCVLNRGLENLGKFQKDLIWFVRRYYLSVLIRGLINLGTPLKRF